MSQEPTNKQKHMFRNPWEKYECKPKLELHILYILQVWYLLFCESGSCSMKFITLPHTHCRNLKRFWSIIFLRIWNPKLFYYFPENLKSKTEKLTKSTI